MTREDDFTNTEADAAHVAQLIGRIEGIRGDTPPVVTRMCDLCQRGVGGYVCGPCRRWGA